MELTYAPPLRVYGNNSPYDYAMNPTHPTSTLNQMLTSPIRQKALVPRLSLHSIISISIFQFLLQLIELSSSLSSPYQIDKVFHFLIGCIHTRLCI